MRVCGTCGMLVGVNYSKGSLSCKGRGCIAVCCFCWPDRLGCLDSGREVSAAQYQGSMEGWAFDVVYWCSRTSRRSSSTAIQELTSTAFEKELLKQFCIL